MVRPFTNLECLHPVQEYFAIERNEDSWKPWDGKYLVKLESFLAHARTRVVTPQN